jgi:hypothetical protein
MGVERNYNSENVSLREENSEKNIRATKIKYGELKLMKNQIN